jgi:hypothetical protein
VVGSESPSKTKVTVKSSRLLMHHRRRQVGWNLSYCLRQPGHCVVASALGCRMYRRGCGGPDGAFQPTSP